MYWFPRKILAQNQTAWVWLVIGIILNDFTMYYREIYFFERQVVIECFFVSMIGDSNAFIPDGVYYVFDIHVFFLWPNAELCGERSESARTTCYAATFPGSSHPGNTSTPGWHLSALARTLARSTPNRTRSFSIADMVAC